MRKWIPPAALAVVLASLCAGVPANARATIDVAGTITPGGDGTCTPPEMEGRFLHWGCTGATERFSGTLESTADAVFDVRGRFDTRSGTTRTSGVEVFAGCVRNACGTLAWRWRVTFATNPETAEVLRGRGRAQITGGGGALAGARGGFAIACEPNARCGYRGRLHL